TGTDAPRPGRALWGGLPEPGSAGYPCPPRGSPHRPGPSSDARGADRVRPAGEPAARAAAIQNGDLVTSPLFRRALITGITGSGGSYLAEYIAVQHPDVQIHGVARWHSTSAARNLAAVEDRVLIHECDLRDLSSVLGVLREVRPCVISPLPSHAHGPPPSTPPPAFLNNNIRVPAILWGPPRPAKIDPVVQIC